MQHFFCIRIVSTAYRDGDTYYAIITNNENRMQLRNGLLNFLINGAIVIRRRRTIYLTTTLFVTGFLFPPWMQTRFICSLLKSVSLYLNARLTGRAVIKQAFFCRGVIENSAMHCKFFLFSGVNVSSNLFW